MNGDIRLVNGQTMYEGRVEVCVNNAWGTVCDDFWDNNDASVVCRQAGFSDQNATARSFAFFGQGTDPIVLDDVRCTGTESRLIDCPYTATHNCIHFEDAGVTCQPCKLLVDCSSFSLLRVLTIEIQWFVLMVTSVSKEDQMMKKDVLKYA